MRRGTALIAAIGTILCLPATASAAALIPLAPASAWTSSPIAVASPPGDPRAFVVERGGGVRIVEDGVLREAPFLTVPNVDVSGERGLLSIAFAPDYASSGLFYVFTVAAAPDAFGGTAGDLRVVEYRRSSSNPNLADPSSARLVLAQAHPGASNHNGGQLAFGRDGLLYVTMGDGGATPSNAQSLANDLGKLLRIDPRRQSGGAPFAVPASNPFFATAGARPEIYAYGLRNPFRASFSARGDLVLPDVGQSTWEEVNLGRATGTAAATTLAGANLGWPSCEGACAPFNPSFVDPVFQYAHSGPPEATGCAVLGGYVVRDPSLAGLTGRYLYGDLCRDELRSLDLDAPGADPRPAGLALPAGSGGLLGFGEDGRGCVYAVAATTVYRVAPSPGAGPACPQSPAALTPAAADSAGPRLSLSGGRRQRLRRSPRLFARCGEACTLGATGSLRLARAAGSAARGPALLGAATAAPAGRTVRLPLRLERWAFARARRALARGRRASLRVAVAATDSAGNRTWMTFRIRLSPPSR